MIKGQLFNMILLSNIQSRHIWTIFLQKFASAMQNIVIK
jgi:hypothetical protein